MEVREIQNKEIWENFLLECEEKTFLQSWNWGEFQKMMGNKIWRLGIYAVHNPTLQRNGELVAVALVVKIMAKRGTFLLVQHGPNVRLKIKDSPKQRKFATGQVRFKILEALLDELKKIAKSENCSFIRMAPLLERNEENNKLFRDLRFRDSPMHANAYDATWKLDIASSEKELLMNMRKTTRYLIRQALKNSDIEIVKSAKIEDAEICQKLSEKVAKYQQFTPFSFEFVKNELEVFVGNNQALLFFGKYKGETIAAALIIFWSGIGFYHQAALDPKYHKIPMAYFLQWEVLKEAKKRGCKLYDFWGYVDPKFQPEHPWAGPTLFKMGFGGYKKEYVKTQDFPLSKKYWLTYLFEKLRKTRRGL